MDLKLKGKTALVTGSSKGIGEAIARALVGEGSTVIRHGRDRSKAESVANDIKNQGGQAYFVSGDLTSDDDVRLLFDRVNSFPKTVDILVNNAGGSGPAERVTAPLSCSTTSACCLREAGRITYAPS